MRLLSRLHGRRPHRSSAWLAIIKAKISSDGNEQQPALFATKRERHYGYQCDPLAIQAAVATLPFVCERIPNEEEYLPTGGRNSHCICGSVDCRAAVYTICKTAPEGMCSRTKAIVAALLSNASIVRPQRLCFLHGESIAPVFFQRESISGTSLTGDAVIATESVSTMSRLPTSIQFNHLPCRPPSGPG